VQTIILGRNFSRANGVLHTCCGSHGVLTTDTYAVEEESPGVTDDPAVLGDTPGSGKHEKTDKHDDSILDETMTTAQPITENTNKNLTCGC
jgi:hypothetical protein